MIKLMVAKRSGKVVEFDAQRIRNAIEKAVHATQSVVKPDIIDNITCEVASEIEQRFTEFFPNVENIQDIVEKHLMYNGLYEIAKSYILYRANRQKAREEQKEAAARKSMLGKLTVTKRDGSAALFNVKKVQDTFLRLAKGYEDVITGEQVSLLVKEVVKNLYDGVRADEIENALILAGVSFIERDPAFSVLSARLLMQKLYRECIGTSVRDNALQDQYRSAYKESIRKGVDSGFLNARMLEFNLDQLANYIKPERDGLFDYLGVRTLYDRYFMSVDEHRIEMPQSFWMRVAMGLALDEKYPEQRAQEFYDVMSTLRYIPSTPTLFFSGARIPQLSSCYLTTVNDDLAHIFKCIGDNAQLAKWSGGIGNDWSYIRATGALIKKTQAFSQGVVPFLKIANDTTVISKTGKRRGGTCAYLETWHLDIEEFLILRKNTGDERRRTHDLNTANWIPDLFMKRVEADENWTLFSPDETPELHDLYGRQFEKKYVEYEEKARNGQIRRHKVVSAKKLWRKMLSMLFETGHPWITFKDPCNIRSPQDHAGVVHSSNLCTEITLNTSDTETAVCNLGSVNLSAHIIVDELDRCLLSDTIQTAVRMLDNVIGGNFYPTPEAERANLRHRPVGLGIMGLQDALYKLDIPFDTPEAVLFSDTSMEYVSYHAIMSSSYLAKERGRYESYSGSKWDRGILPVDTLDLLEAERGEKVEISRTATLNWESVREHIKMYGMRNSNMLAIAPTATISNIAGCCPSIEPIYKNIYVKANVSGEFTICNASLVNALKKLRLWNDETLQQIKYHDGSIARIAGIPDALKALFREAFEIDPAWVIRHAAARGKWIDQSQSLNIFVRGTSGNALSDIYMDAWKMGLKTTYYLRTLAASQIEKSTLDAGKFGFTQKREYAQETAAQTGMPLVQPIEEDKDDEPALCRIGDPHCESCQ
ncbi:MAG: ribonucleoside-diphosphate reductase subunit alpha [Candidatus Auribacterota bacterium]